MTGRRCYSCDTAEARYGAVLKFDFTPEYLLCEGCAEWYRSGGSVVEIHTLRTEEPSR